MAKSKWILGERFSLPTNVNDKRNRLDIAFGVIKNFEAASFKFPENLLDKLRKGC